MHVTSPGLTLTGRTSDKTWMMWKIFRWTLFIWGFSRIPWFIIQLYGRLFIVFMYVLLFCAGIVILSGLRNYVAIVLELNISKCWRNCIFRVVFDENQLFFITLLVVYYFPERIQLWIWMSLCLVICHSYINTAYRNAGRTLRCRKIDFWEFS